MISLLHTRTMLCHVAVVCIQSIDGFIAFFDEHVRARDSNKIATFTFKAN